MVTNKATLEKIREIIKRHYSRLVISVLGQNALTPTEIKELEAQGVDVSNMDSLMSLVYHHNFINHPIDEIYINFPNFIRRYARSTIGIRT